MDIIIEKGTSLPLGATVTKNGVNFSIFSEHATSVELYIFQNSTDAKPIKIITFDNLNNNTFHFWHILVKGLIFSDIKPLYYAYKIDGPKDINAGHKFNPKILLLDPYAKGISNAAFCKNLKNDCMTSLRGVIVDTANYNWEDDKPLNIPLKDTIIYEMHVRGFTKHSSSKTKNSGTFLGIIEKIPYLKNLGITAIELLPIFEFDIKNHFKTENKIDPSQYWGYNTIGFFSPESNYCVNSHYGQHIKEFRDMIKALHKANIEVILDVVYNHTQEGNEKGPILSFKGIDNSIYYHLKKDDKKYYMDYTGCGNTINCNHPIVEKFIEDSLKFWVEEMHVDGFRFDLGSVLTRDGDGKPMKYPPVLWHVELSKTFENTKLIAEAWDAAGLYQIGNFAGYRWAEWNGNYRDTMRKFVRGDFGLIGEIADRISGSSSIYKHSRHSPLNSINFITCHDGFTLNDLVSYNQKHNFNNNENNKDGSNDNFSNNYGVEGDTKDLKICKMRIKQAKNFMLILFLSRGIPMFLAGDEFLNTQFGNNNAYCQDNEISWLNWNLLNKNMEIFEFTKKMINFRKQEELLRVDDFFTAIEKNEDGFFEINWHGTKLDTPLWEDNSKRELAFTFGDCHNHPNNVHVMINMSDSLSTFELPNLKNKSSWYLLANTNNNYPNDFNEKYNDKLLETKFKVFEKSIVILISRD